MHRCLLPVVLAVLPIVVGRTAQPVAGDAVPDRKVSTVVVHGEDRPALAAVFISYGTPVWRESYGDMLAQMKGGNYSQLGKDWWTTLDTIGALEIGGTRIEAGSYYLGLRVDQDGAFSLLLFDSGRAMRERLLPFSTPLYIGAAKSDFAAPLSFGKDARKEVVAKLEIEITAAPKDRMKGALAIRWGRHEATAPVKFELKAGG